MKYYTRNYCNCFSSAILSRKDKRTFCSALADAANNIKNTNIKLARIDDASTELKVLSDGILLGVIFLATDHMLIQPIGKIEVVFVDMFGRTHTIKSVKPNETLIISNEEIACFVINVFELYVKSLSVTN